MGNCFLNEISKSIDCNLKDNEQYEQSCHKLLFLGPGGGGKSTIFKQLQYLHGDGFTNKGIQSLKSHINMQIITQMHLAIKHYLSDEASDTDLQKEINSVKGYHLSEKEALTQDIAESISYIWKNDDRLKGIFEKYGDKQIMWPSTQYFWNDVDRISAPHYIPTKQDVIQVRNMSTGVIQKRFGFREQNFHIFDVGGQKSERRKWLKCFDSVTAVIFVVGLSCYHQLMFEDRKTNCMADAINLFQDTINHSQFVKTPIILFLNKTDLFQKVIKTVPLTVCPIFDDFDEKTIYNNDDINRSNNTQQTDTHHFNQTTAYIKMKFKEMSDPSRPIFTHLTCAMDDGNIKHVFNGVVNIVVGTVTSSMQNFM